MKSFQEILVKEIENKIKQKLWDIDKEELEVRIEQEMRKIAERIVKAFGE